MRLSRLDLVRYGRFTGGALDFGERGVPDLHVVYGANEAGKSTALNAWLDLLFGIEMRTGYGFLHGYDAMQVAGRIEMGDRVLALVRTKGSRNTLRDDAGQVLADDLPRALLGGMDRRALREMFSLDDETLEAGGNSILDSEGEAGQLLFASGAGLAGFAPALAELRKTPDPFFKAPRSGALTEMKSRLAALEEDRTRLDTDARGWKRLVQARDAAQGAWDAAELARTEAAVRLKVAERQQAALPTLRALDAVEARLADLPDLPAPPEGWAEALVVLLRDRAAAEARLTTLVAQREGLVAEWAGLVPDPQVLSQRARIAAAAALRSGHDEAVKDLPARRDEAAGLALRIGAALERLGRAGADPGTVLPGRAEVAALRALIEARSGVVQGVVRAGAEAVRARAEADRARGDVAGQEDAGGDAAPLALLVRRLQDEAPAMALQRATEAADAAQGVLDQRLRVLLPWSGTGAELALLLPPAAQVVTGWKARAAQAVQDLALALADLRRLDGVLAGALVPDTAAGTTLAAAAETRALREAAWAAHRAALDGATAAAFEAAMRRDDAVAAGLAESLSEGRRRAEAEVARAAVQRERQAAADRLAALDDADRALQAEIAAALAAIGLPPMPPEVLDAWLARRLAAVEAWDAVRAAGRGVERARAVVAEARAVLGQALALAGVQGAAEDALAVLVARAQALCDAVAAQAAGLRALRTAEAQVTLRQADLGRAQGALDDWDGHWAQALAAAGLPAGQGVDAVGADLVTLDALAADLRAHRDLADRVAKMEANVAAYAVAVQAVARDLDLAPDAPAPLGDALAARLSAAATAAERLADLDAKLAAADRAAEAQRQALAGIADRVAAMAEGFGAADAADLGRRLAQAAERQRAQAEVARLAEALRQVLEVPTVADARAALAGLDRDAPAAEALRLADEVAARGRAAQAAFAALAEAGRQLDAVGGDDAVLRLAEARETLLQEIAEGARDHLVRRLGLIAVEQGLRRYRDRHRSAMIEAASAAFRTMTRGAYGGLDTQPDGAREVLVAQAAGGGAKRAGELSKGTRFQLYLALRVAAYHERAAQGPVPPFVADDILETFDDDRAAETFEVLAGMAAKGQVIYLTHHRHLCDIARRVCPQVRLHRLE
ncbi:MAG: AAA family ATPase [Gemmobacter sp.]